MFTTFIRNIAATVGMWTGVAWAQNGPADARPVARHGLDPGALDRLVERARKTESDALIIIKDGAIVLEEHFGRPRGPIEAMSATKSVVALAFGRLLADGRLDSLDAPVHRFYPEWKQGRKAAITIRHLLTQRSGLQCETVTVPEIYGSPDFVQLSLCAELVEDPGSTFRYNNKGCNLLAGVVQKISGKRMDVLIGEEIFAPMGITDWSWSLDGSGNPHGMSGLQIRPEDLVKLGRLMLDRGVWHGDDGQARRILPESFVDEAVHDQISPIADADRQVESQDTFAWHYGLLWWVTETQQEAITDGLLAQWRASGAPEEFVTKMAALKGLRGPELHRRVLEAAGGEQQWFEATISAGRPGWVIVSRDYEGFSAEGFLGQYLVVVPEHRLIAVRMRRAPEGEFDERSIDQFKDFKWGVLALVKPGR